MDDSECFENCILDSMRSGESSSEWIELINKQFHSDQRKSVIILRNLFPQLQTGYRRSRAPITIQEYDRIIGTYFPVELWYCFRYEDNEVIISFERELGTLVPRSCSPSWKMNP